MPPNPVVPAPQLFCLTVSCPSKAGQVASIASFLDERHCYVDEFAVFDEKPVQRFFVRCVFHPEAGAPLENSALEADFAQLGKRFAMDWKIHDMARRPRVLILVSKLEHCLADLLFRTRMRELHMDVTAIASNHATLRAHADAAGIPFHHLPVSDANRAQQEAAILDLVRSTRSELVILARYMQILRPETSAALAGRAINIHHSFLPGFKGARPYHQAYERGVKVIGATAHFVTDDLDEGPIIEQVVERVHHSQSPEQLLATGRNLECQALAHAVRSFTEHRVFISGHRTVVF